MEPPQTGLGAWKTCLKWITRACGGLMLSVTCCRPGSRHTVSLPCSSGPVAAGLRGSCWTQLHSGRLQWSAWQQLQPAWLQPAEDSDTGQSDIILANSYALPFHDWGRHYIFKVTNDLNLVALCCLPWVCNPEWRGKDRKVCKLTSLAFCKTGLIGYRSCAAQHRCLWVHEHNSPVIPRRCYFTESFPDLRLFDLSTLMFPSFADDKASQLFSMEQEEAHETPHLAEELLAVDGQWEKKRQSPS